jgi:Gamma-glutamyl cyclotransferase, AIG2-like
LGAFGSPRPHPRTRRAGRWLIARAKVWQLLVALLVAVAVLSLALSITAFETRTPGAAPAEYDPELSSFSRLFLEVARAVLGSDVFPRQPENFVHELLAFIAGIFGALTPALVIAIIVLRLFSAKLLVWRSKMNVSTVAELRSDSSTQAGAGTDGILSVRFYKRLNGVGLSDVTVEAFLGYRERSLIDGSTFFRRRALKVLDPDGKQVERRIWPRIETPMPITLWIPLNAPLRDGKIQEVQGYALDTRRYLVFIKLSGKVVGLGTEFFDQKRYYLKSNLQPGRAAPVEPSGIDEAVPVRKWHGWARFEEPATYGVFVYGSLMDPNTAESLLMSSKKFPGDKRVAVRAILHRWSRGWTVCTDNTVTRKVKYLDPKTGERPRVQVLFLNLEPNANASVNGVVIKVTGGDLLELDKREANYDRVIVTADVRAASGGMPDGGLPDVIWTYVGKKERVEKARRAIIMKSARIRQEYLDTVFDAFSTQDLVDDLTKTIEPPPADIVSLTRIEEDAS